MFKDLRAAVGELNPATEYSEFLKPFAEDSYAHETPDDEYFQPRDQIEPEEIGSGQPNPMYVGNVCIFQATEYPLEELELQYQDKKQAAEEELKAKEATLAAFQREVSGTISDNSALVSLTQRDARTQQIDVFVDIAAAEVQIAELKCELSILEKQTSKIGFEALGDTVPQEYHDRGAFGGSSRRGGRRPPSAGRDRSRPPSTVSASSLDESPTLSKINGGAASTGRLPIGRALPAPPPGGGGGGNDGPARPPKPGGKVDPVALEEEGYFHGKIGRRDVDPLLKKAGDYLVRESQKKPGELALSVKTSEKITHYIIQQDIPGKFRFEGDPFDSVDILISHYRNSGQSVTKRSDAVLVSPVNRAGFTGGAKDKWHMTHADVTLGKKLGNGNFGEVLLGTLTKTGTKCAIKSCKDNVPDPARFLEEADVLKEYEHPNIVKLYGVVSTKPVRCRVFIWISCPCV
jgi:hypothetical protein